VYVVSGHTQTLPDAIVLQNEPATEWTKGKSFLGHSIYGGNDVQPPSLVLITASLGSESSKSTLHLKDVMVFPWLSATLLDDYKGTYLEDVEEDMARMIA
jgi:hypothetical protein